MLASIGHKGSGLSLGNPWRSYLIYLIPIHMQDVCVIVGMIWLSRFGAMIDYERQQVLIQSLSGFKLVISGEGNHDWDRVLFSS